MNIKKPTGQLKDTSLESELTAFPQGSNSYEDKGNEASVISTSGQDHATHDFQHGQTHHESDSLPNLLGDEIAGFSSECGEGVMRSNALRGAGAGLADLKKLSDAAEIASALNKHRDVMQVAQMAGAGLADLKKLSDAAEIAGALNKHRDVMQVAQMAGAGLADLKKLSDVAEIASALNKHRDVMQVAQMAGAGLADLKKLSDAAEVAGALKKQRETMQVAQMAGAGLADLKKLCDAAEVAGALKKQRETMQVAQMAGAGLADLKKLCDAAEVAGALKKQREAMQTAQMAGAGLADLKKLNNVMELAGSLSTQLKNYDALRLKLCESAKIRHDFNDKVITQSRAGFSDEYIALLSRVKSNAAMVNLNVDCVKDSSPFYNNAKFIESFKNAIATFNVAPAGSKLRHLKNMAFDNDVDALASDWSNTGKDLLEAYYLLSSNNKKSEEE